MSEIERMRDLLDKLDTCHALLEEIEGAIESALDFGAAMDVGSAKASVGGVFGRLALALRKVERAAGAGRTA